MNLLLFAGTTEGKLLAERLRDLPVRATVCVATEYGGESLEEFAGRFSVLTGRMDADSMRALMAETKCDCVVDATHPYAVEASANIRRATDAASLPRIRLLRRESPKDSCVRVESAADAAEALRSASGNVLLTTGSKDLAAYTRVPGYAERMYPRVLPTEESIRRCVELGFRRGNIIAMQGPFSRDVNLALMRQFAIAAVVTKDGGAEGGFPEKMQAAKEAGARVIVIGRPPDDAGLDLEEVLAAIGERLEAET